MTDLPFGASVLCVRGQVVENQNENWAVGLVAAVMKADIANVRGIVIEINDYRKWTDPRPAPSDPEEAGRKNRAEICMPENVAWEMPSRSAQLSVVVHRNDRIQQMISLARNLKSRDGRASS
jgi:hypothetical protein